MLVLKINPVAEFVANYLCLLLLGYLDEILHSKTLMVGPEEIYFKGKIVVMLQSL